jgi:hypothetical protein
MRLVDRFEAKYIPEPNSGCWLWIGGTNGRDGYGRIRKNGKMESAHRISYELYKGQIPDGLDIDHLCRNHPCVNPDHLEAVTHQTNVLRGMGDVALARRTNRCKHGHEFTEDNTILHGVSRQCRACNKRRSAAFRQQKKSTR